MASRLDRRVRGYTGEQRYPLTPGSQKATPHQQEISLGIYANPAGDKRAKAEAIAVGGLLACKEFSWDLYLKKPEVQAAPKIIRDWVEEFEQDYFTRRARSPKSETTYREYHLTFNRLPANSPLTKEILLKTITATPPDTKTSCSTNGPFSPSAYANLPSLDQRTHPSSGV